MRYSVSVVPLVYPYMLHSPAVPVSHIAQPGEKIEIIKSEWPMRGENREH